MKFCHLIHSAVATHAGDAAVHMHRVVEISVVGRLVDLHPLHGLAGLPSLAQRLQFRVVLLHLRVAAHADLHRRDIRVRRDFDEHHWEPLEFQTTATIQAIDRLAQVLEEMERDCS